MDFRRVKRGYYEAELKLICKNSKDAPEFEITRQANKMLEASIDREPCCWLWSHKRWKRKRADWEAMQERLKAKGTLRG